MQGLEVIASLPAVAAGAAVLVYARSVHQTRVTLTGRPVVRPPQVAYAVHAALRGQPLLLVVCWSCLVYAIVSGTDRAVRRLGDRLGVIESHDRLSEWWNHHVHTTRELARYNSYKPRHSYERWQNPETIEDRLASAGWRLRWAEYDTQFWPLLATRGDAYDTVDQSTSLESYAR
jgi:hypothetical protein